MAHDSLILRMEREDENGTPDITNRNKRLVIVDGGRAMLTRAGFLTRAGQVVLAVALLLVVANLPAFAEPKPAVTYSPAYSGNYTHYGSTSRGIHYVVIHDIEGTAAGAISWFKSSASHVSAHYVVDYSGAITQMVSDGDIAWHAGNYDYNTHSIGIEHAGYAYKDYWTEAEYVHSAALTRWICLTYGIPMDRSHIIGHVEVPLATHTDPGPYFKWDHYMALVKGTGGGGSPPPPPPPSAGMVGDKVATSVLNVRSGPGTGYGIMGTVGSGQIYMRVTASGDWHKIYFKGNTGWCHSGYTSTVTSGSAAKVTTGTLNVRTGPSTGYGIAGSVHSGELYYIVTTSAGWHKVYWGGGAYWIYSGYTATVGF